MSIQSWSETIRVAELQDDPSFSDDMVGLTEQVEQGAPYDIVLDFRAVNFLNSSNISKLLRLRKAIIHHQHRLVLCNVDTQVWGLFVSTGLGKILEVVDNVETALLSVQLSDRAAGEP